MYRPGHIGVSLLVYAPLGYALLARGYAVLAVIGGALAVALATLPDVDHELPGVAHRGVTHTLLFAACVGAALGTVGWKLAAAMGGVDATLGTGVYVRIGAMSPADLGAFGFAVGALTICSHLLADALTPMGIAPFWPLSGKRCSFGLVRASNTVANGALLALGLLVTLGALWFARLG